MKLIGLIGFAGSGKGAAADALVDRLGFIKESYAKPVKDAVSVIFNWDRQLLEGDTPESRAWREEPDQYWSAKFGYEITPRLALQRMGTEAGRCVFHKDVWIHALSNRLEQNKNYVIADVRFENEIKNIISLGGKIIRINRGQNPEWYDLAMQTNLGTDTNSSMETSFPDIHYSEWAWIGQHYDAAINNNTTIEEFQNRVVSLVELMYTSNVEDYEEVNNDIV